MAAATARVLQLPLADPANAPELAPETNAVSTRFLRQFQLVPVRLDADGLEVWAAQAHLQAPIDALRIATEQALKITVAPRSAVTTLLDRWYPDVSPDAAEADAADEKIYC